MKRIKILLYIFKEIASISKLYLLILFINTLLLTINILAAIFLPMEIVKSLIAGEAFRCYVLTILLVGSTFIIDQILLIINRYHDYISSYINEKIRQKLALKTADLPYQYIEDPYYLNLSASAFFAFDNQAALEKLIGTIPDMVKSIAIISTLSILLLTFDYLLLIILVITIVLTLVINLLTSKYQYKFYNSIIPINRTFGYYQSLLFTPDLAKQMRLNNLYEITRYHSLKYQKQFIKQFHHFSWRHGAINGLASAIQILQLALIYLRIGWRTLASQAIATFVFYSSAATSAVKEFQNLLRVMISAFIYLKYLEPYYEFSRLKEDGKDGIIDLEKITSVEFKNISFAYPRTTDSVLKDISFTINDSETIAIVGLNGAGKTTLIKLLCRLFAPTTGEILINGRDISYYTKKSLYANISTVFQDYRLFPVTVKENIDPYEKYSIKQRGLILDQLGMTDKIDSLPAGINTVLDRTITEGVLLSGGENQKLAIARALIKDSSLIILDEPTSALDPISEADIYKHFHELSQKRMAIYISHRLSSAQFCDKILVINEGKLISYDSHKNLMKDEESLYYKLYTTQAKNYQ